MNGADAQRLQRQLVEKERELRKLRSEREEEIRAAIEATELQVRGEMVKEIRERRLNGEKEEDVLDLAGLRASYEAVERQLAEPAGESAGGEGPGDRGAVSADPVSGDGRESAAGACGVTVE